jgi:predicted transcriptional regulator
MNEQMQVDSAMMKSDLVDLCTDIVSAYVSNNSVSQTDLAKLITDVYGALSGLSGQQMPAAEARKPAVSIKRSVTPDYIVCLEDGKKFKSLKRHLSTHFDMTPEQYREKWGLPPDYPMVAPNYAAARSALAKKMGLGRKRRR